MLDPDAVRLAPDARILAPVCVACGLVTADGWAIPPEVRGLMPLVDQRQHPVLCLDCRDRAMDYCAGWDPEIDQSGVVFPVDDVVRWLRIIGAYDRRRTP